MPASLAGSIRLAASKPCIKACANGVVESAEPEVLLLLQDYYQKVYPRAFKKGVELALRCAGLRHVIAISSPGEVHHGGGHPTCDCANA